MAPDKVFTAAHEARPIAMGGAGGRVASLLEHPLTFCELAPPESRWGCSFGRQFHPLKKQKAVAARGSAGGCHAVGVLLLGVAMVVLRGLPPCAVSAAHQQQNQGGVSAWVALFPFPLAEQSV